MLLRLLRQVFSRPSVPPGASAPAGDLPQALRGALPGLLGERVRLEAEAVPVTPTGALYALWSKIPGGHKWLHYFPIYESLLASFRTKPVRVLEIGVFLGGSLRMWREYLHADAVIVGIDLDPACARHDDPAQGVHVRIGAQQDPVFLDALLREFGPFDVILDDGSHVTEHIAASFDHLFRHGLAEGGLYLVEDTHTSYRPEFVGGSMSFIEIAKRLVDVLHYHYTAAAGPQRAKGFALDDAQRHPHLDVPWLTAGLAEIRFHDQMVMFIKKRRTALPVVVRRA